MTKEQKDVQRIKKKLAEIGPVLPGSISEQWNVCGTPGCRCKDQSNPIKHGPYYQLSYSFAGKSSTMFIKKEDIAEVRKRIKRYKKFKVLTTELVQAYIALARKEGFGEESK